MSRKKHYYRKKRRKRTVPVLLALVVLILGIAGYGNGQADSISSALNTILTAASDLASGAEIQTALRTFGRYRRSDRSFSRHWPG